MPGKADEEIIVRFKQRLELMTEVLELAQRQHRCLEEGKTDRLDRLIRRRDHAMRRWQQIEDSLGSELKAAGTGTLDPAQKERLLELIGRSDELVEALKREDVLIGEAMNRRRTTLEEELSALRKERVALRVYSRDLPSRPTGGVDRSA